MDFNWTAEEAAFRQRLKDFFVDTLPGDWERFSQHPARPSGPLTRFHAARYKNADDSVRGRTKPREGGTQMSDVAAEIKVGDTAPDFNLKDQDQKDVKLSDFRGKKSVVLAFYVLAFTGG